ncbi:uncharacterized protein [Antedon mediterranea]|uniref:uncharacterized protein n=1 Tax=Antedon mediterranea TaxID=105859 RepID=UPI003AF655CD
MDKYSISNNVFQMFLEENEQRIIKQFHFTQWPDKGVPKSASGLLRLIQKVKSVRGTSLIPVLVHCSAGVGRTGTYIVIDAMLDMIMTEEAVDILQYIKDIREARISMVQTPEQYVFIYSALSEFYLNGVVQFPVSKFTSRITNLKRINPETKKTVIEEEYDGYKISNRFIATQMPMEDTVDDFWRLVYDWKTSTIVMLNPMDNSDQTCAQYWLDEGSTKTVGNLKIQFDSEERRNQTMIIRKFSIHTMNMKSEPFYVTQYQVTDWPVDQDTPEKLETLLQVYEMVQSSHTAVRNPIAVHCINGIGRTGVYCTVTEVLDKMKQDDVIDVFQCLKRLRGNRPGLVTNLKNMIFTIITLIQVIVSCLGNDGYITVLNVNPQSNSDKYYQCYTPSTFTGYSLSYGRSFEVRSGESLDETSWDVPRGVRRYVVEDPVGMGVYYCKILNNGATTVVQTTKIRNNALIKPANSKNTITTNVGDSVTITFDTDVQDLAWRKDGSPKINEGSEQSMTFDPVQTSNAGVYELHENSEREDRRHAFIKLIVRACPRHKWGPPDCTGDCEYCYNGGVCDDKTGFCICAPGFSESTCENECNGNRHGWNCENRCSKRGGLTSCKNYQFCLPDPYGCSCVTGYKGLKCNTVCSTGTFGADCAQTCHCKQGGCNRYTGRCTYNQDSSCVDPWTGSNCQRCQSSLYGENCDMECNKPCECHRMTGRCIKGTCFSSWLEPYCEVKIVNTTFTPANNGQKTNVSCSVYQTGSGEVQTMIRVTKNDVITNITTPLETLQDGNNTTKHTFSVISDVDSTYKCVIVQNHFTAESAILFDIFRLPTYTGSLMTLNTSSTTITIGWTAWDSNSDDGDGPVVGYFLYHKLNNTDDWKKGLYQNDTSGTVSELMWDTQYIVGVSAVRPGEGGEGPIGEGTVTAKTMCGQPDSVENVNHKVLNEYPQTVLVIWTQIDTDKDILKCYNTSYIVYKVYLQSNDGENEQTFEGSGSNLTIGNLSLNASPYNIRLTVSNKDSESEPVKSTEIEIVTTREPPDEEIEEPRNSTPAGIIGGVLGAFMCIVIFIVIIIFVKRKSVKNKEIQRGEDDKRQLTLEAPMQFKKENNENNYNTVATDSAGDFLTTESSVDAPPESEHLTYENVKPRRIPISKLVFYFVNNQIELHQEFDLLSVEQAHTWEVASKECNRTKNRFKNIVPYDHARVVLDKVDGDPDSDYYNASYIDGYNKSRYYIASQGPNKNSLGDFWRMIWQKDIKVMVMLTNIFEGTKEKCKKYWPDEEEWFVFDDINVKVDSEETTEDYTIRNIVIWLEEEGTAEQRTIKQFHFTQWPDKGVPKSASGLLRLIQKVKSVRGTSLTPALVHCSAGVGRTGTYIVIDAMLDMIMAEEAVDVFQYIKDIRENRINMVQTAAQYVFIYSVLSEFYLNSIVQFPVSEFTPRLTNLKNINPESKKSFIKEEFEMMVSVTPPPPLEKMLSGRQEHSIKKNRFGNVLPVDHSRVILNSETNNYINASFLNGYRINNRFIATQMPMEDTVEDFWRLVYDWKTSTIVMLNCIDHSDKTCAQYWLDVGSSVTVGNLTIQFDSEESRRHVIIRNMSIHTTSKKSEPFCVTQYQVTDWPVDQDTPEKLETLLQVYEMVQSSHAGVEDGVNPIAVHCINGVGRTGVYCTMTETLDRVKHDDVVDIFNCVKMLRENRPGLVNNIEQYTLCYELVGAYLQQFATYSN